jgi:hypothetical protein
MSTIAVPHQGTQTRGLGMRTTLALVASLLTIGGCYEGMRRTLIATRRSSSGSSAS